MPQPGYQKGGERTWWWKVAMHLDEAQAASINVLAHTVDDTTPVYVLQGKLREVQTLLLEIFRWKGLLPGGAGPAAVGAPPATLAPASVPPAAPAPPAAPVPAPEIAVPPVIQEGVGISNSAIVPEGWILNDDAGLPAVQSHVVIVSRSDEDGWILNDVVPAVEEVDAVESTDEDVPSL